jgi:hypothetical protein
LFAEHDDLLHASSSTNVLKVLGNSGDEVIATGFDDSATGCLRLH